MFIVREVDAGKESFFTACVFGENTSRFLHASGDYQNLLEMVKKSDKKRKLLLLDEKKFLWVSAPVVAHFDRPCTVGAMKAIIDPIFDAHLRSDTQRLFYHMDDICVNWEPTDYYIWKTGEFRFLLQMVAIRRDNWYDTKAVLWDRIQNVHIYPASFFTLHHIKDTLKKQNGTILTLGQHYTKRIVFENGVYTDSEVVDLGWQVLKDVYAENNITDFFDATSEIIENNPYAKNLVEQSVAFYVDMLMRRLRNYNMKGDVFLVSSLTNNEYFMKEFNSKYQQYSFSFVVPLMHMKWLKTFGRTRAPDDIDIQTAAHYFI